MAKRHSTSKVGRGRKANSRAGNKKAPSLSSAKRAGGNAPRPKAVDDFGGERAALMKAEAVLACLSVSLNYYGWCGDDGTLYAVAADVARDLVQEGMDRLERRDRQIETGKHRPN